MSRTLERKTWADRQAIPTVVWGEKINGITIAERNRATVFEYRPAGIQQLLNYCHENYRRKGVNAVVAGVYYGNKVAYAVFVKDGFLREIPEDDEDLKPRKRKKRVKGNTTKSAV